MSTFMTQMTRCWHLLKVEAMVQNMGITESLPGHMVVLDLQYFNSFYICRVQTNQCILSH